MDIEFATFENLLEGAAEALHPDLEACVREASVGKMVHHPLIVQLLFPGSSQVWHINKLYEQKVESLKEALKEGNFRRALFLYERPYRLDGLMELRARGLLDKPALYWSMVSDVWRDSENIWENRSEWSVLWGEDIPERHAAMDKLDRKAFDRLPELVPVWRGVPQEEGELLGMSWTTEKARARWFARRFDQRGRGVLYHAHVAKEDIVAYLVGRGESEAIIMPDNILDLTIHS